MKKALSILLAAVMMLAVAVPAFAADSVANEEGKGNASQTVTATYDKGSDDKDVATVYSVTVAWDVDSSLKYSDGNTTYTWNAGDTKYEATTENKGWTGEATVNVTVTNKSNAEITATAAWAAADGITVECTLNKNTTDIESAAKDVEVADGETGAAKTDTFTASVAAPTEGTIEEDNATVGTITVTIAPKAAEDTQA